MPCWISPLVRLRIPWYSYWDNISERAQPHAPHTGTWHVHLSMLTSHLELFLGCWALNTVGAGWGVNSFHLCPGQPRLLRGPPGPRWDLSVCAAGLKPAFCPGFWCKASHPRSGQGLERGRPSAFNFSTSFPFLTLIHPAPLPGCCSSSLALVKSQPLFQAPLHTTQRPIGFQMQPGGRLSNSIMVRGLSPFYLPLFLSLPLSLSFLDQKREDRHHGPQKTPRPRVPSMAAALANETRIFSSRTRVWSI